MGTRIFDAVTAMSYTPPAVATIDAYDATTDTIIDVRGMKTKGLLITNTHATHGLTFTILGSYDEGAAYDIVVLTDTPLAALAQSNQKITDYYTHFKIRVKSTVAATPATAQIKFAALGV